MVFSICGKFSYPLDYLTNKNIRYICYAFLIIIMEIIAALDVIHNVAPLEISVLIFELMIFIFLLLECNLSIFKQSLVTFNVYYKTINVLISIIAYAIDYNNYKDYYNYNSKYANDYLYIIFVLSTIKNTSKMLIISILDGYHIHGYMRTIGIIIYFLYLCYYYYYISYFTNDLESINAIGNIFGYPFSWHTIAISCMNNAIIFLLSQMYLTIRKPLKLVFIPILIKFKFTQERSLTNRVSITQIVENYHNYNYESSNNYNELSISGVFLFLSMWPVRTHVMCSSGDSGIVWCEA